MYSVWQGLAGIFFIWVGILTFLIWQQNKFLKSVFPKSGEADFRHKFEELLEEIERFRANLKKLEEKGLNLENKGLIAIQRVELERFNPYDDTGGDQSFTIALLDDKGTGIVVTSLHARSGTRIFAKDVTLGKSGKYKFSVEEERIVKKAMTRV